MRVAGVDIGFRNTGVSVFDVEGKTLVFKDSACFSGKKTKAKEYVAIKDAKQTYDVLTRTESFIQQHKVQLMIIELPTGGARSSRAARGLGIATCMAVALPMHLACPTIFVTPRDVKIATTGNPEAEKKDIIEAVSKLFPEILKHPVTKQEHVADSVGCVLHHFGLGKKKCR